MFKYYVRRLGLCVSVACIYSTLCYADATCDIDENKKHKIYAALCGQLAREPEYRFSGQNCLANSISKRLEDSAIQIHFYRLCGDHEFSERLKEANLRAIKFMEALSICTPERVNLGKIMEDALARIAQRAAAASCSSDIRMMLIDRRSYFERMIGISSDPNIAASIFEKLGIRVDDAGNIREK